MNYTYISSDECLMNIKGNMYAVVFLYELHLYQF